jgi:hypothetical protein
LLTGAAALLALGVANPDAWIARHNLDRYQATGKVDWTYLEGLSHDAVPTFAARAPQLLPCLGRYDEQGWPSWNLSRARAADLLPDTPAKQVSCPR